MNGSSQFQNAFNSSGFGGQNYGGSGWSPAGPSRPNSSSADPSYLLLIQQVEALGRENASLRSSVDETNAKLEEVDKKFKNVSDKLTVADSKIDDLSNNISQVRNKTLEPLAIFVGLFTFVSIGFQTFANVKDPMLWPAILTIVLGGIIILAGLILHASSIARDTRERRRYTALIIFTGLLIGLAGAGIYSFAAGSTQAAYNRDCVTALSYKFSVEETKAMCRED